MRQYLELLARCATHGMRQKNRTGVHTLMVPGAMLTFDMAIGFPIVTTKTVNFKAIVAELLAFITGAESAATFRAYGTKIWDANANENKAWLASPYRRGEDDLGRVYGAQWRDWRGLIDTLDGRSIVPNRIDQLARALETLEKDPTSRRIIVSAWQPAELAQMALPPCHLLFQLLVEQQTQKLHMTMYQRSCDMFLGVPFNISSYALLLKLIAYVTRYTAGTLTMFLADVHVYENHLNQVAQQLGRDPRPLPMLRFSDNLHNARDAGQSPLDILTSVQTEEIWLDGYDPHPPIKAEMAV